MNKLHARCIALLCAIVLLTACTAERTPQEVTQAFWQAVIENDAKGAVRHSTLTDVQQYDGFGRDWSGFTPAWGRIVIEGAEASIETTLTTAAADNTRPLTFVTHLVRQDEQWQVDYARTAEDVNAGPLAKLFGRLERLGKDISQQLASTSDKLALELERMGEEFEELSRELGGQATASAEKFADELRRHIDALAESARRALEERERQLSDQDRQTLQGVVAELDEGSARLDDEPTLQAIAASSESVASARQQLATIDGEAIAPYKEQWDAWGEQIAADLQRMLDELVAVAERPER